MVYGGVEMCICPSGHMGKTCEDNGKFFFYAIQ